MRLRGVYSEENVMRKVTFIFAVAFLVGLATWAQHAPPNFSGVPVIQYTHPVQPEVATTTTTEDSTSYEVAFIPRGPGGIHYFGDAPGSERAPQGPGALAVDGTGGFWLLDTVAGHLLHLNSTGKVIANLDLSKDLIHGAALASQRVGRSQEERIAVYDLGAEAPRVIEYDQFGRQVARVNLPLDWTAFLHKISLNADGSFDAFLVTGDNIGRYRVSERLGKTFYAKVRDLDGRLFGYWGVEGDPTATWTDHIRTVDPDNVPAEKEYLGRSANGDSFFRVGEFAGDAEGNMYVDVTIQRFRWDGSFSGIARVPVREQYITVESNEGIALDSHTGNVYVLVPQPTGASIRQLDFVQRLEPLPPIMRPVTLELDERASINKSATTGQMITVGNSYCNAGQVYIPTSAVSNDAIDNGLRTKPPYLTSAGNHGVPYSFGGFDTRANFATHMSGANSTNHYKAGDVDTTQQIYTSGTGATQFSGKPYFGVDCSGFVSRCWGLSKKAGTGQGTATEPGLLAYVANYCPATFQQGDIMLYTGHHVRMYIDKTTSPSTSGLYLYEESLGNPYGVWLYSYTISSQVSHGYVFYRYAGATSTGIFATVTSCPYY
jgi:hypothetical protein